MSTEDKQKEMNKILFVNLVMMLGSSAMQQLGKLMNPMTGKTDINLEGAQITIDLLTMLREKTRGNLDKEEDRMLGELISNLQMNYVSAAEEAAKAEPAAEAAPAAADAAKPPPAAPEKEPSAGADPKAPKFRKSYGEK